MDYKVTYHDNPQAYQEVSNDWKFTLRRNESGTWIFPPLAGVSFLIEQFVIDRPVISKELYGNDSTLMIIDCTLSEVAHTKDSLERELFQAIVDQLGVEPPHSIAELGKLFLWLSARRVKLGLLVYGLDAAIRTGDMEALSMLNRLAMNNHFLSVILLLCTDVTDPQFWPAFSKNAALIQNISVIPRKSIDEGESFFRSLEDGWGVKLSPEQRRWVDDNLDGSLRFTKEVFRQVQKNPALTYDELFTLSSLEYKVQALLDNFLEDQREVILRTVFGVPITVDYGHAFQYLKTIRWIIEDHSKPKLAIRFVDHYIRTHDRRVPEDQTSALTHQEEAAFTLLQDRIGTVVKREDLADKIWGDEAAARYSDWAIDQLMHRLKLKLSERNSAFVVHTVRGHGFMLEALAKS